MKFKAIAWDMDGTLIDSEPLYHRAIAHACEAHGYSPFDIDEATLSGRHMHDVWRMVSPRLSGTLSFETWLHDLENYYIAHSHDLKPIENSPELIQHFRQLGLKQACVSNSSMKIVIANLSAIGILDQLDFVVTLDDVTHGKPDPEPYLTAIKRFGLDASEVVVVEDSLTGVQAARAAQLQAIKYKTPAQPADAIVIHHLNELVPLITA